MRKSPTIVSLTTLTARLFARIRRPHELIDAQSYQVDLSVPRFEIIWAGQAVSVARVQLIATYMPELLQWGSENPGIAKAGTEELKAAMADVPELAGLLTRRTLQLEGQTACDLADWIAYRTSYEAMYPALVGDTPSYLALNFIQHHGEHRARKLVPRPWQAGKAAERGGCGGARTQVAVRRMYRIRVHCARRS